MRFLLDTCVISELVKPRPARRVVDWVVSRPEEHLYLSVLTLGELARAVNRLEDAQRRQRLSSWLEGDLKTRFAGRWLPVDEEVTERWGVLASEAARRGLTLPVIDGLLAATAVVHGMVLVTRDVGDLGATGAMIVDPWPGA